MCLWGSLPVYPNINIDCNKSNMSDAATSADDKFKTIVIIFCFLLTDQWTDVYEAKHKYELFHFCQYISLYIYKWYSTSFPCCPVYPISN